MAKAADVVDMILFKYDMDHFKGYAAHEQATTNDQQYDSQYYAGK